MSSHNSSLYAVHDLQNILFVDQMYKTRKGPQGKKLPTETVFPVINFNVMTIPLTTFLFFFGLLPSKVSEVFAHPRD